jgi:hypothetical protein
MGKKLKYGERTKWVSVRVPESKAQLIRPLIREFVEILFLPSIKPKRVLLIGFIEKVLLVALKKPRINNRNRHFREFQEFFKDHREVN